MQLTTNFKSEEFTTTPWEKLPAFQQFLFQQMAKNLQVLREACGLPFKITSAMRTLADYQALKVKGYNPSETSDHFYGVPVPISNPDKQKLFGAYYNFSVGATDFTTVDNPKVFAKAQELMAKGKFNPGQLIHEQGNGMNWIHLSNNPQVIYGPDFCSRFLKKPGVLVSNDAGKTYQAVA